MKTVTFVELDAYIRNHPDLRESTGVDPDDECGSIKGMTGSETPLLRAFIAACGLVYDDNGITITKESYVSPAKPPFPVTTTVEDVKICLDAIDAVLNVIHHDYDCPKINDADTDMWKYFDLSGDDDVDYNASYWGCVTEVLRAYWEVK